MGWEKVINMGRLPWGTQLQTLLAAELASNFGSLICHDAFFLVSLRFVFILFFGFPPVLLQPGEDKQIGL